jgi:hypothetical protein
MVSSWAVLSGSPLEVVASVASVAGTAGVVVDVDVDVDVDVFVDVAVDAGASAAGPESGAGSTLVSEFGVGLGSPPSVSWANAAFPVRQPKSRIVPVKTRR